MNTLFVIQFFIAMLYGLVLGFVLLGLKQGSK
jgi:hypothetical protein